MRHVNDPVKKLTCDIEPGVYVGLNVGTTRGYRYGHVLEAGLCGPGSKGS